MKTATPVTVLPSPDAVGEYVAGRILDGVGRAKNAGKRFLLGTPTGRTPRPILGAMARRLAESRADISHVTIVMMDEYLVSRNGTLEYAPAAEPWSCHQFARVEIAQRLNAGLPTAHK